VISGGYFIFLGCTLRMFIIEIKHFIKSVHKKSPSRLNAMGFSL
jgi:hypothetical protein